MEDLHETNHHNIPKPCFECGKMVAIRHVLPSAGLCGTGQLTTYLCAEHSGYDIPIVCRKYREWTEYDTKEQAEEEIERINNPPDPF